MIFRMYKPADWHETRMIHQFPLDPRSVLGIGPDASLEEVERAFRAKSMKHHPDHGGDEWAFRIVSRAYEILKSSPRLRAGNETPSTPEPAHRPRRRGRGTRHAGYLPLQPSSARWTSS